jgi:hypothetical protein
LTGLTRTLCQWPNQKNQTLYGFPCFSNNKQLNYNIVNRKSM